MCPFLSFHFVSFRLLLTTTFVTKAGMERSEMTVDYFLAKPNY